MKPHALIHHSISLVLRLIDSITGLPIEERDVRFLLPSDKKSPIAKGEGVYLFVNVGREDFELEIHIYGYESKKAKIFYDTLDEQVPIQELYFLPKDYPAGRNNVLSLRGKMLGITEIEAVSLNDVVYSIKEYEERKRKVTLINPHNVRFSKSHYGILSTDRTKYEIIEIEKEISLTEIVISKKLELPCDFNQSVSQIVWGQTEDDGTYMIKVPEDKDAVFLVRYVVDEEVYFRKVDFNQKEELGKGVEAWD